MDQALRNLAGPLALPLPDAVRRVSTHAAQHLGLADRGALIAGAWADIVVLDGSLQLRDVICEGELARRRRVGTVSRRSPAASGASPRPT
jgi:N-acetylglucosamine-6-phosphate deacetylase